MTTPISPSNSTCRDSGGSTIAAPSSITVVGWFQEQERLGGHRIAELGGHGLRVVAPDPYDLAPVARRSRARQLGQRRDGGFELVLRVCK